MTIINYNQNHLRIPLIVGLSMIILYIIGILFYGIQNYLNLFVMAGAISFGTYFHRKRNPYILIDKNKVKVNYVIPEHFYLTEIVSANFLNSEYTIKTKSKTIKINSNIIEKNSLTVLRTIISESQQSSGNRRQPQ